MSLGNAFFAIHIENAIRQKERPSVEEPLVIVHICLLVKPIAYNHRNVCLRKFILPSFQLPADLLILTSSIQKYLVITL